MTIPKFCPNPSCVFHIPRKVGNSEPAFWAPFGTYWTRVVGEVRRFRCRSCGKTFGERTFQLDYYTKKTLGYREMQYRISSGESVSAIARAHRCSVGSVQNRLDRLSRNALLFHSACLDTLVLKEGLTADGFESFDRSQFHPSNINLLVGTESQFLYGVTHTTLRRKGRMTSGQKNRRTILERVWKPPRGSFVNAFADLVAEVPRYWKPASLPRLEFRTDEHRLYPVALMRDPTLAEALGDGSLVHRTWSSRLVRSLLNPLFPVNYYDRELRKDLAAFHRESVCFTRNVANGMNRLVCHLLWHNYQKEYRIRWGTDREPVHAVVAGVPAQTVVDGLEQVFCERLFPAHYRISPIWKRIWMRGYKTPLKVRAEIVPKYVLVE